MAWQTGDGRMRQQIFLLSVPFRRGSRSAVQGQCLGEARLLVGPDAALLVQRLQSVECFYQLVGSLLECLDLRRLWPIERLPLPSRSDLKFPCRFVSDGLMPVGARVRR